MQGKKNVLVVPYNRIRVIFHTKDGLKNRLDRVSKVQQTNPGVKQVKKSFVTPGSDFH